MNVTIDGREVEVPPHIAKWAHRMNDRALREAVLADTLKPDPMAQVEAWVVQFRDRPDDEWDPDFRPITAEDLTRRQE